MRDQSRRADMSGVLRVVSWNVNRRPSSWNLVRELDADVVLLQEATSSGLRGDEGLVAVAPSPSDWKIINGSGAHGTAVVVKSATTSFETVSSIRASHPGQFGVIRLPVGEHGLYVINLYAIFDGRLADASTHRAISDLTPILAGRAEILMAGDFNAFRGYTLGSNKSELRRYETVFNRWRLVWNALVPSPRMVLSSTVRARTTSVACTFAHIVT